MFIVACQTKHEPGDVWYIDSGASRHMTGKKEWFRNLKEASSDSVKLGDDIALQVKGIGEVPMIMPDGKKTFIGDVLFIPGLEKNLISVSHITNKQMQVQL